MSNNNKHKASHLSLIYELIIGCQIFYVCLAFIVFNCIFSVICFNSRFLLQLHFLYYISI